MRLLHFFLLALSVLCAIVSPNQTLLATDKPLDRDHASGGETDEFPRPFVIQFQPAKPLRVDGQVVDDLDKPLHKVHVAIIAVLTPNAFVPKVPPQVLGQTTTGVDGKFHLNMPSLPPHQCVWLYAVARRDGFGFETEPLDNALRRHMLTFHLKPEQTVRRRLIGPTGQPAKDVTLSVRRYVDRSSGKGAGIAASLWSADDQPAAWPPPAISDEEGWFELKGVPETADSDWKITLAVDDVRYALDEFSLDVAKDGADATPLKLAAPRIVKGTILGKDTDKPISGAWLLVVVSAQRMVGDNQFRGLPTKTDAQGRFRCRCAPGRFVTIYIYPPEGTPYPAWATSSQWPSDALEHQLTIPVPRGILVHGKIVEADSKVPVVGAGVEYQPASSKNPYFDQSFAHTAYLAAEYRRILTDEDGQFKMAVIAGPGNLLVKAATPDFVSHHVTFGELQRNKPGGHWLCVEGLRKINPTQDAHKLDVVIPIKRGQTIYGKVSGPDGQTVDSGAVLSSSYSRFYFLSHPPVAMWNRAIRDSRFELRGCDLDRPRRAYLFDPDHQWGATVNIDAAIVRDNQVKVQLSVCGRATARLVNEKGQPWANHSVYSNKAPIAWVELVDVEAPPNRMHEQNSLRHIAWQMPVLDEQRHRSLRTDVDGRVCFPTLIPGARYKLIVLDENFKRHEMKDFIVTANQNLDLGEIIVKRVVR